MKELSTLKVFSADGCPHCNALRADFKRRGVVYEEVNLSQHPQRLTEVRGLVWERRLPVVVDHERVSIGFNGGSSTFAALGLDD